MNRRQHIAFHLGDLAAAALGCIHALIDSPPKEATTRPFSEGFDAWKDNVSAEHLTGGGRHSEATITPVDRIGETNVSSFSVTFGKELTLLPGQVLRLEIRTDGDGE